MYVPVGSNQTGGQPWIRGWMYLASSPDCRSAKPRPLPPYQASLLRSVDCRRTGPESVRSSGSSWAGASCAIHSGLRVLVHGSSANLVISVKPPYILTERPSGAAGNCGCRAGRRDAGPQAPKERAHFHRSTQRPPSSPMGAPCWLRFVAGSGLLAGGHVAGPEF